MGIYITADNLIVRYPVVKDWAKNNTEMTSELIDSAEGRINELLSVRYSTPFSASQVPITISDLTKDMAYSIGLWRYDLDKAGQFENYVMRRINALVAGSSFVYVVSGYTLQPDGAANTAWSNDMNHHTTFSMLDNENKYTLVSSERLYAEEQERD